MKRTLATALVLLSSNAFSWDFGARVDAQRSSTNNVNLTDTDPISDQFSTVGGYLQAKGDIYKLKLKGRLEKYQKQTENDNYSADLSLQYKPTKNKDFTFAVFNQVYNGTPAVSTDTTSDNNGARVAANFNKDFDKETSGYITLTGAYKKYSKIAGRNDKIFGVAGGLENYFTSTFMANPELNIQSNTSADSYYSNVSFGPILLFSYTPDDKWELFCDGSYTRTSYSGRTVTKTLRGRNSTEDEYQTLVAVEAGAIYTFEKHLNLQAKYSSAKNSSNNATAGYKAHVISFNIGLKY